MRISAPSLPALAPSIWRSMLLATRRVWLPVMVVACGTPGAVSIASANPPAVALESPKESPEEVSEAASSEAAEAVSDAVTGAVSDALVTHLERDIVYAVVQGVELHCDIYQPAGNHARRPAVVIVHGGGWAAGDKWTTGAYGRQFAEAGMVAVSINYRHAPEWKFPAQVDDVRAALVWLSDNADQWGIDRDRIGMYGYSAGGHLVCMIGTLGDASWETVRATTQWAEEDPRWQRLPKIRAIAAGAPPCEFRDVAPESTVISYFLGGSPSEIPEVYEAASPVANVSSGDVPTLFVHGTQDAVVPIRHSEAMLRAMQGVGVECRLVEVDGQGHLLSYLHPTTLKSTLEYLVEQLSP